MNKELKEPTSLLGGVYYLDLKDSEWVIIDSTPIVDEEDEDSEVDIMIGGSL